MTAREMAPSGHRTGDLTINSSTSDVEDPDAEYDPEKQSMDLPERPQITRLPSYNYEKLAQKNPKPTEHLSITIGPPVIILLDLIVPCIIYYTWHGTQASNWRRDCSSYIANNQTCPIAFPEFDKDILGYAIISFGMGELYILVARVCRLFYHRDECAPLLSRSKWELDATAWVYGVAMIVALIPFVVGSSLVIPELYLYGPSFLMAFLGVLMVVTFVPFPIPIGINSHARGTPLRPFIYYAAEDFIAVDGLQDREFRVRYNTRWSHSKGFRRLFRLLTLWWLVGVCVYIGSASAIIWTLKFHYAFGLTFGILFAYIIIWSIATYVAVRIEMARERRRYEETGHC
jgi:hypothetical protein